MLQEESSIYLCCIAARLTACVQGADACCVPVQFEVIYTSNEAASIQNDTIIISSQQANNHQLKLAICFALAQVSSHQ